MDEVMRDRFMELVYDLLRDDDSNQRANAIINCADEYAESMKQRWIPVTERLPEIDKEVLVTDGKLCRVCSLFESQDIEDGLYQWEDDYGHWHEFGTWVAWMPLPEYYQEEGEQE